MTTDDARTAEVRAALTAMIADEVGEVPFEIRDLRPAGGGSSRENWLFDLAGGGGGPARPCVLRCDPARSVVETSRRVEVDILRALSDAAVPTPLVLFADPDGKIFGRPAMIMTREPGVADRQLLTEKNRLGLGRDARLVLMDSLADILAGIHAAHVCVDAPALPPEDRLRAVDQRIFESPPSPRPELRLVSAWLHAHLPTPTDPTVLVHGDFRPANLLIDEGRVAAVLDWELAHVGEPTEDLGWYLTARYRAEHFVDQDAGPARFVARYLRANPIVVDPDRLAFWTVFAGYQLAEMALAALEGFATGEADLAVVTARPVITAAVQTTRDIELVRALATQS